MEINLTQLMDSIFQVADKVIPKISDKPYRVNTGQTIQEFNSLKEWPTKLHANIEALQLVQMGGRDEQHHFFYQNLG